MKVFHRIQNLKTSGIVIKHLHSVICGWMDSLWVSAINRTMKNYASSHPRSNSRGGSIHIELLPEEMGALQVYFSKLTVLTHGRNDTQSSTKNDIPRKATFDLKVHEANESVDHLLSEYRKCYPDDLTFVGENPNFARPFDMIAGGYRSFRWLELLAGARWANRLYSPH